MPEITVMMPARNAARYVRTALVSTLRALPRDAEIVVWDDASTDGTASRAHEIGDPRISIIESATSVGSGAARAAIVDRTDSRLLAAMDADDVCLPRRFATAVRQLGDRLDVAFTGALRIHAPGLPIRPVAATRIPPAEVAVHLVLMNPFIHSTMVGRRETIAAAGGYGRLREGQDYELWLRLAAAGARLARYPGVAVLYRHHAAQVSAQRGYASRILADPEFRRSYRSLVEAVAPGLAGLTQGDGTISAHQDAALTDVLTALARPLAGAAGRRVRTKVAGRDSALTPLALVA